MNADLRTFHQVVSPTSCLQTMYCIGLLCVIAERTRYILHV